MITLNDISKLTGLNISTVSRALNDNPKISKKTKELVKKVAKENNYVVNEHASLLAKKKSNRIGLVFPEDFFAFNKRDFFAKIEQSFLKLAKISEYNIILIRSNDLKKVIGGSYIDGLIIANRDITKEDIDNLDKRKVPYVFVAYKPFFKKFDTNINVFKSDNFSSGYEVAKYLYENGARNLLTITSKNKSQTDYIDRTLGFLKFCEENKKEIVSCHIKKCNMTFEEGKKFIEKKREELLKYDAIFCQEDKVALGILSLANKYKINIPKDLSIIGFDNLELINYFEPKLTTVKENFYQICSAALTYLIETIECKEQKKVKFLFKTKIIEGQSTLKNVLSFKK